MGGGAPGGAVGGGPSWAIWGVGGGGIGSPYHPNTHSDPSLG